MSDDPLAVWREQELDLEQLVEACRRILERAAVAPKDRRVAPWPDARTIRYYQSAGLVDRPRRYEGRQAIYGFAQLLQAVAVKLLQAEGLSLAQVQAALLGASSEQLEGALREALERAARGSGAAHPRPESPLATGRSRPEPGGAFDGLAARPNLEPGSGLDRPLSPEPAPAPPRAGRRLFAVELAEGIQLTIDPECVAEPEAVIRALRRALARRAEGTGA